MVGAGVGPTARDEWWEVVMALYGYRQSPRLWSDYRDSEVHQMRVDFAGGWLRFDQMLSEPGLWKIVMESEETVETGARSMEPWWSMLMI